MLQFAHIDMNGNEIQNVLAQNLSSAPSTNVAAGRFYFNTADHTLYVYNGSAWVDALSQGDYTFQNGVELVDGTRNVQIKLATGDNAGNVVFTANSNGLKGEVDLSGKVDKNDAITGATKCKITYDSKGLVTAGADLEASDIPSIALAKISDVTASAAEVNVLDGIEATTAELNIMHGVTVTASDINSVTSKIGLTDLSIAAASANYLTYDNTSGEFAANVDTTVTAASTNLVTSGAVETAIGNAIVGGVNYKGTWAITTATTDFSGITLPVKKGYLYLVTGTGPATVGGIEWNPGDYLMVNADVAAGGSLSGKVDKIDNTEAADIVRLNATQTLTNKTIDCATSGTGAGNNTITNLPFSAVASGAVVNYATGIAAVADASDAKFATEKAIADAIKDFITASSTDTLTNKTIDGDDNTIQDLELGVFKSGVVVNSTTGIAAASSASDSKVATEKAIATKLDTKVEKFSAQNGALTATSGVCTWTITNSIGSADVQVAIYQVSSGAQVGAYVEVGASNIVVKFNSASDIAADTFKAVVIGL